MAKGVPVTIIRYITSEMTKTFALVFSIVTMLGVFVLLPTLIKEGLGPAQFFSALPLMAVTPLAYTLPLAVLFGVSIAYGRMSAENEIRAMAWHGLHVGWMALPAAGAAVVTAMVSLYLTTEVVPAAWRTKEKVFSASMMGVVNRELVRGAELGKTLSFRRVSVRVKGYDSETGKMSGITVIQANDELKPIMEVEASTGQIVEGKADDAIVFTVYAEKADSKRQYVTFVFTDGKMRRFDPENQGRMSESWTVHSIAIDFGGRPQQIEPKGMSLGKLAAYAETAEDEVKKNEAKTLLWERVALGMSPLFFAIVAAPMSMVARWRHTLTSFLPSLVVVVVAYYPLVMWAKVQGESGSLNPMVGMFIGNGMMLVLSAVLAVVVLRR